MITPTKLAPNRKHVFAAKQVSGVADMVKDLRAEPNAGGWDDKTLKLVEEYCVELARQLLNCPGGCR